LYTEVKQHASGCLAAKSQEGDSDFRHSEIKPRVCYWTQAMTLAILTLENTVTVVLKKTQSFAFVKLTVKEVSRCI